MGRELTFAQICAASGRHGAARRQSKGGVEFGMRSDEVVSKAVLNTEYTPSPSLLPTQSPAEGLSE